MSEVTERIKERIGAADLIGEYLKLERAGANYRALCPFHNEKTPSFMVNPERNFWYCFGCQKGGDIFNFVQDIEGLTFRETLTRLAERAGVELPRWQNQEAEKEDKDQKKKLWQILEEATLFFQTQLEKSRQGAQVKKYLFERGLTQEAVEVFRLGFIPAGWRHLLDFLLSRGHSLADIEATGLLVKKEGGAAGDKTAHYDRFRERIIFPVADYFGKVVGFSARVLPGGDEKSAKYINTPQTAVYDKSQVLYGFYQAKSEIKKQDRVILAEGNMDIAASYSAGVKNIIAISGTAFSRAQAQSIKRLTSRVSLCLDMDQAGRKATEKTIKICLENDLEVDVISLPAGNKDINDVVMRNRESWSQIVQKNAVPVMKYFFDEVFGKYDVSDPRGKKMIARDLLNLIKEIADPVEKEYWLKKLSQQAEIDLEVLAGVLEKVKKAPRSEKAKGGVQEEKSVRKVDNRLAFLQEQALGIFWLFSAELKNRSIGLEEGIFDSEYSDFWKKLVAGEKFSREEKNHLENFAVKARFDFDQGSGFREKTIDPFLEWSGVVENIRQARKKVALAQITADIKRADQAGDEETVLILSREYERLLKS